jgi:hypothetical protein
MSYSIHIRSPTSEERPGAFPLAETEAEGNGDREGLEGDAEDEAGMRSSRDHDLLLPLGKVLVEELFARRGWEVGGG